MSIFLLLAPHVVFGVFWPLSLRPFGTSYDCKALEIDGLGGDLLEREAIH